VPTSFVTLASLARSNEARPAVIAQQPQRFEWVVDTSTRRIVRRPLRTERSDATLPSRGGTAA